MLAAMREEFLSTAYVDLTSVIPPLWIERMRHEVRKAVDEGGLRRQVYVRSTGNSPRYYTFTPREQLRANAPSVVEYYGSPQLRRLLSQVTGSPILPSPFVPEEFVAARYEKQGDTHGWHWDDYAYALVWVLEAPQRDEGGDLEFIPHIPWRKDLPNVEHYLRQFTPVRRHPDRGTVYLLRSDTTLHRVTPLQKDTLREVVCFTYAAPQDLQREVTHETLDILLGTP